MKFLAVDDEELMLKKLCDTLRKVEPNAEIYSYMWPEDVFKNLAACSADTAFLDIQMGGMSGLELATRLKSYNPDMHIVFVTGFSEYAVEAFQMHATGYLLKPYTEEAIRRELTFIYGENKRNEKRVRVQTFGGFDVTVDGEPVKFARSKAKELFAFLINSRGAPVTTGEAYAALFEDAEDDVNRKGYLRTITSEMKNALNKVGAGDIVRKGYNSLAVVPELIECDYYRFLEGDPIAVNQYHNDYLPAYSWAELKNAEMFFHKK